MERDNLIKIIDSNGRFNLPTIELEALADHLIANGIGDVAHTSAEVRAKEALKHFESHCHDAISGVFDAYINDIAQGVDEKLNDYKNEAERLRFKLYETEQQLIAEKHRADRADEALDLAYEEWTCCDLCMFSFDCKTNRTDCKKAEISKIKQKAEARLKELEAQND